MNPELKYGDLVRVKNKFYEGLVGPVIQISIEVAPHPNEDRYTDQYLVKLKFNDLWFNELDLEKFNETRT